MRITGEIKIATNISLCVLINNSRALLALISWRPWPVWHIIHNYVHSMYSINNELDGTQIISEVTHDERNTVEHCYNEQ